MPIPHDYPQRVYAGVLGKIIGVYLGRPFEGWTYQNIMENLGEVRGYVHQRLDKSLIVADDDISGTFTFLRALADHGYRRDLTPAQIGQTWLNYIIENRTILWWGGLGTSTEHTAFLRLQAGLEAPESGSIAANGKVVAEQIGAQIFIDGWAMVAPGDPALAADLARRAASVSHDGEAIHGAQVVAAMEAQAFVERDIHKLLDTALSFIPRDSVIARMIADLRGWRAAEPEWRKTREKLEQHYGYDRYGGGCHMVPNHGVIILALLYGGDDFQNALAIANTCGWDTDCNSGNVGCLTGIRLGLEAIDRGPTDWRGPVADRMFLPTADGGRAVTDAATEAMHIINAGRTLAGLEPLSPKQGARYHFTLPGSMHGFIPADAETAGRIALSNPDGRLAMTWKSLPPDQPARMATATFILPDAAVGQGYGLVASPSLYPGQTVRAAVHAARGLADTVAVRLFVRHFNAQDALVTRDGPAQSLTPGQSATLVWRVPALDGQPIAGVGIEARGADRGAVSLDSLTWDGPPDVVLGQPAAAPDGATGQRWKAAWVNAADTVLHGHGGTSYSLIQNRGRGMMIQGTRQWTDYRVSATLKPHMVAAAGVAARVQGLRRYHALLLVRPDKARLVRMLGSESVLREVYLPWEFGREYRLTLQVRGWRITAWVDDRLVADLEDRDTPLTGGGVALVCEEGRLHGGPVRIQPATATGQDVPEPAI